MRVESAGIGNHPDSGVGKPVRLLAATGPRVAKGRTVCGKAGDCDDYWVMQGDEYVQPGTPRPQLGGGELISPRGRAIDQVGDTDATLHQICAVLLRHRFTAVKITINNAGDAQRRIETVAWVTEISVGRCRLVIWLVSVDDHINIR